MKHTPGPWKAWMNYPGMIVEGHSIKVDDDVQRPIAMLWVGGGTKGKPTQRANARLIASAPELLEACKEAETAIYDAMHAGNLSREYSNCVIEKIEQAIAKAEGKQT